MKVFSPIPNQILTYVGSYLGTDFPDTGKVGVPRVGKTVGTTLSIYHSFMSFVPLDCPSHTIWGAGSLSLLLSGWPVGLRLWRSNLVATS